MVRQLSPFPYKVELKNPNLRIRLSTVEEKYPDLFGYMITKTVHGIECYNPLIKIYHHELVCNWCNFQFGSPYWDYELRNEYNKEFDDMSVDRWIFCFLTAENSTFFDLMWN